MSATAFGKLFIGWWFKDEPLQVPDGKHYECYYSYHALNGSTSHCPRCGGRVIEVDTMVPSPLVANFAAKRGISIEEAMRILSPYQHKLPKSWHTGHGGWVLGVEVVEVTSNNWDKVTPETPPEVRGLLIEAGMPVGGESIYMAVWLC